MSDGEGTGGAGAGAGAGGEGAGAGAVAGGGAAPEWLGSLPADLHGDATLGRYADVEALARGHVELRKVAGSKLAIPGADATPEQWNGVFEALGRPKEASAYEIPLPEGLTESPMADAFRPIAHGLGLLPNQVKGVAEFFNAQATAAEKALADQSQREVDGLKTEWAGDYDAKVASAQAAFKHLGFSPEEADQLVTKLGSATLIKGFAKLGEQLGEHGRKDGDADKLGQGLENAAEQIRALNKDAGWRERYNKGDAEAVAQHNRLLEAAKRQAATPR